MKYKICGPFEVPRDSGLVTREPVRKREFWDLVDDDTEGLSDACGVYIFLIRSRVWYVGCAEKQAFYKECFTPQKIMHYDEACNEKVGAPYLIFVARMTPTGRFSKPSVNGYRDILFLEDMLIGIGLRRNEKLRNISGTVMLKNMRVPGLLNAVRGHAKASEVKAFRRAMGIGR